MGNLKLHNCTKWKLRFWRSVMFASSNYVAPGKTGHYSWGATYTLKAEKDGVGHSRGSRHAVNQSGDYYAYYANGKIHIYSHKQFQSCTPNDDNPNVSVWRPDDHTSDFEADWRQMQSIDNTSSTDMKLTFTEVVGFDLSVVESLKVIESTTTGVSAGMSFLVKGVTVDTSVQHETSSEKISEHITSHKVYGEKSKVTDFVVEAGASLVIWQIVANVFGQDLFLDHVVYADKDDGKPTDVTVDKMTASYNLFQ